MAANYISDIIEVSKTAPFELDVVKTLGIAANTGWITSDDGTVYVQINNRGAVKIPLNEDESLTFKKEDDWIIRYIYITTDSISSLTVRYMLRYIPVRLMPIKAGGGVKQ